MLNLSFARPSMLAKPTRGTTLVWCCRAIPRVGRKRSRPSGQPSTPAMMKRATTLGCCCSTRARAARRGQRRSFPNLGCYLVDHDRIEEAIAAFRDAIAGGYLESRLDLG